MYRRRFVATALGAVLVAGCLNDDEEEDVVADEDDTRLEVDDQEISVEEDVTGLVHPWGITFLPAGDRYLVTERAGTLRLIDPEEGTNVVVDGVPEVVDNGQGGLLDVTVDPSFEENAQVYLSYVVGDMSASATAFGRGALNGGQLESFEELFVVEPYLGSSGHFGSRIRFGEDGQLYATTGDRQSKDFGDDHISQDLTTGYGAVLRIAPDGSIPEDNPFVGEEGVEEAIYAYGIRNAQGLAVHPATGELWASDHGEQDGDAIIIIEEGGNHGWPIAHYGCTYDTGEPVGDLPHEREDVIDPVYYWECNSGGFPPAGMTVYDGDAFPEWAGDLFIGNLAGEYLGRFRINGREVEELEPLLADRGSRIRDVAVAPESGDLLVLVDDHEAPVLRLTPR